MCGAIGVLMKFFYVCYYTGEGTGAMSLAHNKTENGFNIASAYQYLRKLLGKEVVILNWEEITESRHSQFKAFLSSIPQNREPLTLIQGGKSPGEVVPLKVPDPTTP